MPAPSRNNRQVSLLLINDGQNMEELGLGTILAASYARRDIAPLLCAAIHCGADRKNEYGTACAPDYKGRGAKAGLYARFVMEELIPFISQSSGISTFKNDLFLSSVSSSVSASKKNFSPG